MYLDLQPALSCGISVSESNLKGECQPAFRESRAHTAWQVLPTVYLGEL